MVIHSYSRPVAVGVLIAAVVGTSFGLGRLRQPGPMNLTIQVTGAPGMVVNGTLEIDGVTRSSTGAVPVEFAASGHKLSFTVRRLDGPDRPLSARVAVDGQFQETGTARGGLQGHVWDGPAAGKRTFLSALPVREAEDDDHGRDFPQPRPSLIGTRPPEWTPVEWVNAESLRLADLRGRVVLVRWFTGPHCPDCLATAPALREFHERYRDRGLSVVGMFHHADSTLEEVRGIVAEYGYRFPVGIDRGAWTRRLWCLGRGDFAYTSATFLLDRDGIVRHTHPGGRYVKGDADYAVMEWQIEQLLTEDRP